MAGTKHSAGTRSARRRRFTVAAAAGAAFAMATSSIALGEGLIGVGVTGAEGTVVAVAPNGNASSSQGVAVSGTGSATAGCMGLGTNGVNTCVGGIAVSGAGNAVSAAACPIAIEGVGLCVGGVAVSGTSDASAPTAAVATVGETNAPLAASAWGVDVPMPGEDVGVPGQVLLAIEPLLDVASYDPPAIDPVDPNHLPGPDDFWQVQCIQNQGIGIVDLTRPGIDTGCTGVSAMGLHTPETDGENCFGCVAYNGMRWVDYGGDGESVGMWGVRNSAEEIIDNQHVHGTLIKAPRKYQCHEAGWYGNYVETQSDDRSGSYNSNTLNTRTGARGDGWWGENKMWVNTSGHDFWDGGTHWEVKGEIDYCKKF